MLTGDVPFRKNDTCRGTDDEAGLRPELAGVGLDRVVPRTSQLATVVYHVKGFGKVPSLLHGAHASDLNGSGFFDHGSLGIKPMESDTRRRTPPEVIVPIA